MRLIKKLRFILMPTFWLRNHPSSAKWDDALNKMLDCPSFERNGAHTIILNGRQILVSNYPYAYGSPYGWGVEVLPHRDTVARLHKAVDDFYFDLDAK
jgi:hypothetical protein